MTPGGLLFLRCVDEKINLNASRVIAMPHYSEAHHIVILSTPIS
jgi:hypothetical protein